MAIELLGEGEYVMLGLHWQDLPSRLRNDYKAIHSEQIWPLDGHLVSILALCMVGIESYTS